MTPVNLASYPYAEVVLEATHILRSHFGNEIYIRGNCDQAPFSLASSLRTPEEWLGDLMDEDKDELVHLLLKNIKSLACFVQEYSVFYH